MNYYGQNKRLNKRCDSLGKHTYLGVVDTSLNPYAYAVGLIRIQLPLFVRNRAL